MSSLNLRNFLTNFAKDRLFWGSLEKNYTENTHLFEELGSLMIDWAVNYLGHEQYFEKLAKGYKYFVIDVNKSQIEYEKRGAYKNKSYEDVYKSVYNNANHMQFYH